MQANYAKYYTNISELRKHPTQIVNDGAGEIIAVFNHNEIISYMVSPEIMEELLEMKADIEALKHVEKMDISKAIKVDINDP